MKLHEQGHSFSALSRQTRIPRRVLQRWWLRCREQGRAGLQPRSRRPRRSPARLAGRVEERVLRLRRRGWGPMRIALALGIGHSSVHRVLRRHGRSQLRPPVRRPVHRYEKTRPGELVHLDVKYLYRWKKSKREYEFAAEFLRSDHPQTLRGITLLEEGPEHYAVWKHLCAIVREGGADGFVREFGRPIFVHAVEDRAYGAVFDEAMSSLSRGETAMVLEALATYDFSEISHLCDVGGGHGHLLCSLLAKHPHLRGTVYELPSVVEQRDLLWVQKMNVATRCEYVAGDMFTEVPAADAYFLKHILHDWDDADCVRILSNIHKAAAGDARVFVAEYVVPGPEAPHFAKLFDIHMMCATGGRERTEEEYAGLFERAGWAYRTTWHPPSKLMGVVEAAKA